MAELGKSGFHVKKLAKKLLIKKFGKSSEACVEGFFKAFFLRKIECSQTEKLSFGNNVMVAFTLYRITFHPIQKCSFSLASTLYRYSFGAVQVQNCSSFLAGTKLYRITLSSVSLPSSCFQESYNLPSFKSEINKLDLISLSS